METLHALDELWDFSDAEATEGRFRAAIEGSDDESYRAEALTQVARTQGLRSKFEDAHDTLDLVASVLPRVAPRVETRYLLERGRVWNSSGTPQKARELFLHAFDGARRLGDDYLTIDAAHMVAIVEEPSQALEWNLLGFRILEESRQDRAKQWTGALSNNIAWTYHDMGDHETALSYFEKGLAHRAEAGKEPALRIARWAVARCKRSLGRMQEALDEQLAIQAQYFPTFDPVGEELGHSSYDGYLAEEVAECLLALGRAEESKPYFRAAHALLANDERLAKSESARIERLSALAKS